MAERVSVTVDGYEIEYSREPVLALLGIAKGEEHSHSMGIGGTGWSGRVHAWSLTPVDDGDPFEASHWRLTATEPESGMLGSIDFDNAGTVTGIRVTDVDSKFYGTNLNGLLGGWTNALGSAGPKAMSSQGDVKARRIGDEKWEAAYLRVGEAECGTGFDCYG